jgi:hypothetical protein
VLNPLRLVEVLDLVTPLSLAGVVVGVLGEECFFDRDGMVEVRSGIEAPLRLMNEGLKHFISTWRLIEHQEMNVVHIVINYRRYQYKSHLERIDDNAAPIKSHFLPPFFFTQKDCH